MASPDLVQAFGDYCERSGPGLWAEPWNVITNLAFIVAAVLAARDVRRFGGGWAYWDLWLLIALLTAIGIGSALWHVFAQPWAELADIIPIALFINVFLLIFLWRVVAAPLWLAVVIFAAYQGVNFTVPGLFPAGFMNGSMIYLPAWLFLAAMALYLGVRRDPLAARFVLALAIFCLSVTLRSVDWAVCGWLPVGTHFLWHLLNAVLLYGLIGAVLVRCAAREGAAALPAFSK